MFSSFSIFGSKLLLKQGSIFKWNALISSLWIPTEAIPSSCSEFNMTASFYFRPTRFYIIIQCELLSDNPLFRNLSTNHVLDVHFSMKTSTACRGVQLMDVSIRLEVFNRSFGKQAAARRGHLVVWRTSSRNLIPLHRQWVHSFMEHLYAKMITFNKYLHLSSPFRRSFWCADEGNNFPSCSAMRLMKLSRAVMK